MDLLAFKKSFSIEMSIFRVIKQFPKEEIYSLTDQIRRSSRSITVNIAEAYRKRRYPNHFISKLSDSDAENAETQTWLLFALKCDYITNETYQELNNRSLEVGKILNYMISFPEKFNDK